MFPFSLHSSWEFRTYTWNNACQTIHKWPWVLITWITKINRRVCPNEEVIHTGSISYRKWIWICGATMKEYSFVKIVRNTATATAKSLQSCPTLCDPIDGSPPDSPVPGILQARILEWVAISFSKAWRWKVKVKSLRPVRLWVNPWTAAYWAPPSMGFSRQEYWGGVPSPSL